MTHPVNRFWFRTRSLIGYALQAKTHYYVHAPFAYHLCTDVLYERKRHDAYNVLAALRGEQRADRHRISFTAAGTAKRHLDTSIADVARRYALPMKYARLLYRLVHYLKPNTILETGTGTGFSAAALALGNRQGVVHTVDAVVELSNVAERYHRKHGIRNIRYHHGIVDDVIQKLSEQLAPIDFIYLDANHTHDATIRYTNALLPHLSANACIVVDDVHWSRGMKKAWTELTLHPSVTLSVDLFRLGMLFTNPTLNREALRIYF